MASAASGLRHPASASCLGRHARLTGRCPNNSSLFPPLAAVVVVASRLQRKNYLYFRHTGASADAPVCHFHGWGRKGDRHLQRLLPAEVRREPSQSSLHDARFPLLSLRDIFPRPGEVFPLRGSFICADRQMAKSSLPEESGERSEPERVGSLPLGELAKPTGLD